MEKNPGNIETSDNQTDTKDPELKHEDTPEFSIIGIFSIFFRACNEGYPKVPKDLTFTEKAHSGSFSWLKAPPSAFTFKTLLIKTL